MSTGSKKPSAKRSRASLEMPPGKIRGAIWTLRRRDVLVRLGLCALAAVMMWAINASWAPPFSYRPRYVPPRAIVPRVAFSVEDKGRTEDARRRARESAICYYANDPRQLDELQQDLLEDVFLVLKAQSYEQLDTNLWQKFFPGEQPGEENLKLAFEEFRNALASEEAYKELQTAVNAALADLRQNGLLSLLHEKEEGSLTEVYVYPAELDDPAQVEKVARQVPVSDVLIRDVAEPFSQTLLNSLGTVDLPDGSSQFVASRLYAWLRPQFSINPTLTFNLAMTTRSRDRSAARVEPKMDPFFTDKPITGIVAGKPLDADQVELLRNEHEAYIAQLSPWAMVVHSVADLGMYVALYILCGLYVYYREPRLVKDLRRFATLLGCVVLTVALIQVVPRELLAEIAPIVMFAIAISVAHRHELSLLLAAAVSLIASLSLGLGLAETVVMIATVAPASFLSVRVRQRTKLIYVGLCAGAVGFMTTLGVGTITGQPFGKNLLIDASLYGMWAVVAGMLTSALLPFVEKLFDVQTDLSLLELGDASHPLLQELVRRAPGTYNHSINVASLGEAATEAIGGNGLLVRVGAYFHDIGKMLKPAYFIENQGEGVNRHNTLMPAMSTLVIIAHVKDGVDLARQHHLPRSIIDFIEQHHGTTLVEYFYREAAKKSEANPDGGEVDEATFRYPGPKPQTKEAAVMMLADACESTSRTLSAPSPARLESLVHELALKRLSDGQFDECGLTLKELHIVEERLVKALSAVYHGRVKYPDQQTA